ncbi:MAG TPA: NUDIX domain-containing protein [Actinomycetes bacterium]|nr:NUDIX domain-containing protein [Actinomycetes bacterium]
MRGDGDGWVQCNLGHRHWGKFGAAGLMLFTAVDGQPQVLLQHRAPWCHHGDTWGIPGGARDSHEDAVAAALREAGEEAGVDPSRVTVHRESADEHGGWTYTTVIAYADHRLDTQPNAESLELAWQPLEATAGLPLHPGFAATWPELLPRPVELLVDTANVVGSRPDGWWRDRVGATNRQLAELATLRSRVIGLPGGGHGLVVSVTAVLEGIARQSVAPAPVGVVQAQGSGDDALAERAAEMTARAVAGELSVGQTSLVVVTADRGLRARLPATAQVVGPRWLAEL